MPNEEKMTVDERYRYLRRQQARYRQADRAAKGRLLDEMEAVTELHRKNMIRQVTTSPDAGSGAVSGAWAMAPRGARRS